MSDEDLVLQSPTGYSLAAKRQDGKAPWVIFLGGFRSDMEGTKAQ